MCSEGQAAGGNLAEEMQLTVVKRKVQRAAAIRMSEAGRLIKGEPTQFHMFSSIGLRPLAEIEPCSFFIPRFSENRMGIPTDPASMLCNF